MDVLTTSSAVERCLNPVKEHAGEPIELLAHCFKPFHQSAAGYGTMLNVKRHVAIGHK